MTVTLALLSLLVVLALWDYRRYAARTNAHAVWAWIVTRILQVLRGNLARLALDAAALKAIAAGKRSFLAADEIPQRSGERPQMVHGLPHRQLNQHPSAEMRRVLLERVAGMQDLPGAPARTKFRPSLWELTGAEALVVQDCAAHNCSAELMRAKGEFAHVHSHDGSLHLMMALPDIVTVIEKAWGEYFAVSGALGGKVPHIALAYAPRTAEEIEITSRLLRAAYQFATTPAEYPA